MATEKPKTSKKRGPRPQGPYADKRKTLTTRITGEMRNRLETAANDSGRSLSQEIESRLEQSFVLQGALGLLGADANTAALFTDILHAKALIEAHAQKSVWDDYEAHITLSIAVRQLLLERTPDISAEFKKRTADWEKEKELNLQNWREDEGVVEGLQALGAVLSGDASPPPQIAPSPQQNAEMLGKAAAYVIKSKRGKNALAEALMRQSVPSDLETQDDE